MSVSLPGGVPRVRRDMIGVSSLVTAQWTLSKDRYDQLMAFYRTALRNGVNPFEIDLILDGAALERHHAQIIPGTFSLAEVSGGRYVVRTELEVYQLQTDLEFEEALIMLYGEYGSGDEIDAILLSLEELVNVDLYIP